MEKPTALIVGTGLGGLTTALRLAKRGYQVKMVEQYHQAGGRLNRLQTDGFTFDMGPTFFSMSYEFDEFVNDCRIDYPFEFHPLDPLYSVYFRGRKEPYTMYKNIFKLSREFEPVEPHFREKMLKYLQSAEKLFHDVDNQIIKQNYNSILDYFGKMIKVPWGHAPKMVRSVWNELDRYFESLDVKTILSLVAFFLGDTPFKTPAVYSILNYTELIHDGYHNVKGGMYGVIEGILKELKKENVEITYNTKIVRGHGNTKQLKGLYDGAGNLHEADIFIVNADAAAFRGQVFHRKSFSNDNLDKMKWTMAPFTIYLGIKGQIPNIQYHSYFLGNNFKEYADKLFSVSASLDRPYYYVNVPSKNSPGLAPAGDKAVFILCPVPDLRHKSNWDDKEKLADIIVNDLSDRIGYDIKSKITIKTIFSPQDWESMFGLYRGSGLGLAHNLSQMGGFRPKNFDEQYRNVYYVGASTVPGTGLPMAVISSNLVVNRIIKDYGQFS